MQQSSIQKVPLPSLLLKKSTASAAAVAAATTTTANAAENNTAATTATANASSSTQRRCIFDCDDNSFVLCRFPVHDRRRCNNWLKFFKVSPDYIKTHGLLNLRVCLKHFHQQNQMAKTRMKTTPTRLQKDALTAEDIKKRLRQVNTAAPKEVLQVTSSVLVTAPKRTNSISSATSTVSLASDAHSAHSDSEFIGSLSPKKTTTKLTTSKPLPVVTQQITTKPLNPMLNNQGNFMTLKNRKVFMITESCDELKKETDATTQQNYNNQQSSATGQKRKMYLIMEEAPQQQQSTDTIASGESVKNEFTGNACKKKLTLFTDKCDAQLTQKFEQILPEILSRINNKVKEQPTKITAATTTPSTAALITTKLNGHPQKTTNNSTLRAGLLTNERSSSSSSSSTTTTIQLEPPREPITLPPKKNRMKIINTAAPTQSISAATPVIVSATQFINSGKYSMENKSLVGNIVPLPAHHKNINLSTDFLFLMKMLPKLEAIPEPHKNHVKNCIEKIVTQNAALFHE